MMRFGAFHHHLRAAARALLRAGDDAVSCSFCGQGQRAGKTVVTGPGAAICTDCAQLVSEIAYAKRLGPRPEGREWHAIGPLLQDDERLTREQWRELDLLLGEAANRQGAKLLSWVYRPAEGEGDYVAVSLETAADADGAALQNDFVKHVRETLGLPPHRIFASGDPRGD